MKRTILILISAVVLLAGIGATIRHNSNGGEDDSSNGRWEYLVVSASNNVNFSSPSTGSMRKEAAGFQREAFVLEQNFDKLGEKGWQLVSVTPSDREPVYYFKRRK